MTKNATFRQTLRWIGWLACACWLAVTINYLIFQRDPDQFSFRAPVVEAEMKNCTSEDMHQRYSCKEQAMLSHERLMFVEALIPTALVFAPPLLVWLLARRLMRRSARRGDEDYNADLPPSIKKWRVK
jgi:hypothetical protein